MKSNPIGIDIDPEELWEQVEREGEDAVLEKLKHPVETGAPRGLDSVPAAYMA